MNATIISIFAAAIAFILIVAGLAYAAHKLHRRSFITDEPPTQQSPIEPLPLCADCMYNKLPSVHEPCNSCLPSKHLFKKRTSPPELRPEPETEPLAAGPDILKSWEPQPTICQYQPCGITFLPKWPRQKRFCSPECAENNRLQEVARKKLQPHNPPKRPGTMPVG